MASQNFGLACSKIDLTPIGTIEVLATANGIYQVNLLGRTPKPPLLNSAKLNESDFSKLALQQIVEYLAGQRRAFDLPLDWSTSNPFQKKVLARALAIPFGQVATNGELARELGGIAGSRAVGGAMARNPGGHGGHGGAGPGWPAPGSNVCPFGFGLSCCPPNAMCVAPPTSPAP